MNRHQHEEDETGALNIMQGFGKYQILQYLLICIPTMVVAMNNVNYVFVAGDIEYRCRIPECESVDDKFLPSWWPDDANDRCSRLDLNYTYLQRNQCDKNSFLSTATECTEWIYGSNDTIVAWLDLACKPWKTNFVGTIHMIGWVVGMVIGGWASDTFGRKPTCIVASVGIVVGTLKTFTKSYYGYISLELIESIVSGVSFSAGMILMFEISSIDKRVLSGAIFAYAIYLGEASLAVVAMVESPRWLVLNKKFDKTRNILKIISKSNKLNVKPEYINKLNEGQLRQICNVEINTKVEGYKEAFKSKEIIKRLIVATTARFTVTFIYFGLIASSVWLPGNKYTNYLLTTIMSFPGDLLTLYSLNKFGRRLSLSCGFLLCGIACVMSMYVPASYLWLRMILYLIAKIIVAACYTGVWTYTMELFPTSVRGSMFGLVTLTASAGCILAPLSPAMDTISPAFSSFFYGVSSITSAILILFSPETKGLPLAGTIEEVIIAVKNTKNNKREEGVENRGFDDTKNVTSM